MEIERALRELLGEDVEVIDTDIPIPPPAEPVEELPVLEPLNVELEDDYLPLEWTPFPPPPLKSAWRPSDSFRAGR